MSDLNEVISLIRSCLLTSKGSTAIENLNRDYKQLEGENIPFRRLGFTALHELINQVPGLRVYRRGEALLVEVIPTAETAHIASMVAKQKSKSSKRKKPVNRNFTRFRRPNISTSSNSKGSYSSSISSISSSSSRFTSGTYNQRVNLKPMNNTSTRPNLQPIRRQQSSTSLPPSVNLPKLMDLQLPTKISNSTNNRTDKKVCSPPLNLPSPPVNRELNGKTVSHVSPPLSQSTQQSRANLSERLVRPPPLPTPNSTRSVRERSNIERHVTFSPIEVKNNSPPYVAPLRTVPSPKVTLLPSPPTSPQLKDPRDELINLVKLLKLPEPEYKIFQHSKQNKINAKLCSVTVGPKKYSSYPAEAKSEEEAEKLAAVQAVLDLHKSHGPLVQLRVTSDVEVIKQRLVAIVDVHNGVLIEQLPIYYKEKHNETLPDSWINIVEDCPKELTLEKNGVNNSFIIWRYNAAIHKTKEQPLSPRLENIPSFIGDAVPTSIILPTDDLWPVYVQNVINSSEIWVVINEDNYNNRLVAMTAEMLNPKLEPKQPASSIEIGRFYVMKEDESWYRVRVDNVNNTTNQADIFYIDTGDYETVAFSQLYPLDKRFCDVAAQAIKLSLTDLEEFTDCDKVTNIIEELLLYQPFYVSVKSRENIGDDFLLNVTFYDTSGVDDVNINDLILQKFLSTSETLGLTNEGRVIEVYLSHIELNGDIYVQMELEGLKIIATLINRLISPSLHVELLKEAAVHDNIDMNEVYLVKCPDGNWLRSKVLEYTSGRKLKMLLIDFGGTVIVDNTQLLRLQPLSPVLEKYPPQAHNVQLINIEKTNFNEQMMNRLLELAPRNERLLCKIIKSAKVPIVELFKRSQPDDVLISINNTLTLIPEIDRNIEDGNNNVKPKKRLERSISRCNSNDQDGGLKCLRRPPIPEVGEIFDVHVTGLAANPSNFIVQPYADIGLLSKMMVELQTSCNEYVGSMLTGDSLRVGKLCAAKYNDGWYRASINGIIDSQTVVVYLCDYGDMTPTSTEHLQPLKKQFTELPYQGIKARLYGIEPINVDWTPHTCTRFQDLVANKDFASIVRHVEKDDTSPTESILSLELIDVSTSEDIKIHEKLVNENRAILTVNP
ncbi:hypothetical protein PV326_011554 [Microctonus aethiopoides]|nr:hypothetical protein PV326_011554 [Microctonus aethiopoides]